jgi:CRISPR-associated protein Cmr3
MNFNTVLIEPTDLLFFRDPLPMAAGQGKGAGCRMPFPSTLHEAFRGSLLRARGEQSDGKKIPGRPRKALRTGNWRDLTDTTDVFFASKAFRSLRTVGPLPWQKERGVLLPVPHDAKLSADRKRLTGLQLWWCNRPLVEEASPSVNFQPLCLPLATTPADKRGQLRGWWTMTQYRNYLAGEWDNTGEQFKPIATDELWQPEHHIGVQIESSRSAAAHGQLYAASYMRPQPETRFAAQFTLGDGRYPGEEDQEIQDLNWLLLGGEFRLARLLHRQEETPGQLLADLFQDFRTPPEPNRDGPDGPCLLKWTLISPAIFAHGHLPGWCVDTNKIRSGGLLPVGRVCLRLPGQAHLVSWCLGKPRAVSGWDIVENRPKPTMLAVPEGGVYYFVCENRAVAHALAEKLHWNPRSDFYGEKGCGYGLCSFADRLTQDLSAQLFKLFKPKNTP